MAGRPIERYVTKQIDAQGGYEALIERIRQGETVAMIARTLSRPDGQPIDRTTCSHLLHARNDRSALVDAAKKEWRKRPQRERLVIRKRLRATAPQRALRAMGLMHAQPAPAILPIELRQRTIPTPQQERRASPPYSPARSAPSVPVQAVVRRPVVTPPTPTVLKPPPMPETPPRRHGVEWDERRPWCYDCDRNDCPHSSRNTCAVLSGISGSILRSSHG